MKPIFAVRWIKPYIEEVRRKGGFCWIFKTQIYPLGFEELTRVLYRGLKIPVSVGTELPKKSVRSFENWVRKNISNANSAT